MFSFFSNIFGGSNQKLKEIEAKLKEAEKKNLTSESQIQALKLELSEREKSIDEFKSQLSLQAKKQEETLESMLVAQMEPLLKDISGPLSQLATQAHLSNQRQLQVKDVISVSMRLVKGLEDFGLRLEGTIGEIVNFDSSKHEGLSLQDDPPCEGSPVQITMPGVSYENKLLKKIAVLASKNKEGE